MDDQPILDILNQTPPKHVWSKADRELLAVAQKLFDVSNKDLTLVFNHLSRDALNEEGFTEGLKVMAIAAQISDLKRTGRGEDFREIQSMAPTAVRNKFDDLTTIIQEAARNLGLRLRSYADPSLSSHVSPSKRPTARTDEWASDNEEDNHSLAKKQRIIRTPSLKVSPANTDCDLDDTTTPTTNTTLVTPASLVTSRFVDSCSPGSYRPHSDSPENDHQFLGDEHFAATSGRIPPLLRINYDNSGRIAEKVRPRLLFRAYNPEHGLVARRFLGQRMEILPPPAYSSNKFRDMASRHLYEDKTFMSPFLSWTESPKRALKLIETSKVPLSMAIADFNVLEEHLIQRFGKGATPWLVPDICDKLDLTDLKRIHDDKTQNTHENRRNYTGTGEFLTWGSVACDLLIGTLDTAAAVGLYTAMQNMMATSYQAGSAISEYLQDIREIYREVVAYKLFRTFRIRDCVKHTYRYELFVRGLYGEDPGDMSDNSTSDGQETVNCLRCNKPPSMFGGRLDKLHGKPREVLANWVSMSEEHLQNLLDAQLSNTGALFGIIVDTDESSGGAEGKGTMENAKAAIKAVSSIDDGAVNNFQVGPPQPDSRSTKVLDMLEWQPIKPPPSSSDLRKKTTHGTSSTNVNVLKILRDQRQMILTAEEKPASSDHHGPNRGQKGSQPSSTKASLCRCGNAHIDLTDDNDSANYTPGKKKAQTATAKAANTHPIPSPSQKAPQTNTSIADPSPQIENTNGFTIEALNDIEDDADDELQIIGEASIRRRRTLRTRTRTVLTYRSRSLSEAVVHPKN